MEQPKQEKFLYRAIFAIINLTLIKLKHVSRRVWNTLPKRPREHQLEDKSETAFKDAVPDEWVYRSLLRDYGVDGEVEIFDSAGNSTGLKFLVQLKATAEPDLDRALAVSLDKDKYDYYWSLDLPVLMVRYHAPTQYIFARWFHTYDPYYDKKGTQFKRTFTFRWSKDDRWGDNSTAEKIALDVKAFRQVRSSNIPLPVSLTLTFIYPEIRGVSSGIIASAIRKQAKRLPAVIRITESGVTEGVGSIVVSNDKVVVELASIPCVTIHMSKGYPAGVVSPSFPFDVLILVALALGKMSHSNIAAQMIAAYAENSFLTMHPERKSVV